MMKKPLAAHIAILLSLCMLLASCKAGGEEDNESTFITAGEPGRYIETDVTPEGVFDASQLFLLSLSDGTILCYSQDAGLVWKSTDGGSTWEESAGFGGIFADVSLVHSMAAMDNDEILVSYTPVSDEGASHLAVFGEDGASRELSLEGLNRSSTISSALSLPDNKLFVSYSGLTAIDQAAESDISIDYENDSDEGQQGEDETVSENEAADTPDSEKEENGNTADLGFYTMTAIFDIGTGAMTANLGITDTIEDVVFYNNSVYMLTGTGELIIYDSQGSLTYLSVNLTDAQLIAGALYADDQGVCYADNVGIQVIADEGPELAFPAQGYTMSNDAATVTHLVRVAEDEYLVALLTGSGPTVYRYTWDPDAVLDESQYLHVWALEDSNTLRAAVNLYQQNYPDGFVELEIVLGGSSSLTKEDAIRSLNTAVLAGSGPDIIILDGLPIESYAGRGALADLTGLVDTSGYYESLLAQCELGGGLYFLPARFTIPVQIASSKGQVASLEEFAQSIVTGSSSFYSADDVFVAPAETDTTFFTNYNDLWDTVWAATAPELLQDNAIYTEALSATLAVLKAVSDHYNLLEFEPDEHRGLYVIPPVGKEVHKLPILEGGFAYQVQRYVNMSVGIVSDMRVIQYMFKETHHTATPLPGIHTRVWTPRLIAGINEGSGKKELAGTFITLMLADEVQGVLLRDGLPVTAGGAELQIGSAKQSESFNEMVNSLALVNLIDDEVQAKIYTISLKYCRGELPLEAAVGQVETELKNYLAERE